MKTLLIIPTYNELENLRPLLDQVGAYAPQTDMLIVDDHSPDGTGELADQLCQENARVHVLHRPGKLGLATPYLAGFQYALHPGYDEAFCWISVSSLNPHTLPPFHHTTRYPT